MNKNKTQQPTDGRSSGLALADGSAIPSMTQCPLCLGWHGGPEDSACYRCRENPPARHGAYWLHPDGWYRLFPPAAPNNLDQTRGGQRSA